MPPSYVCSHRCVPFRLLTSFDTDRRQKFTHDRIERGTRVPDSVRMIRARIVCPLVALPGGRRARGEGIDCACLRGLAPVRQTPALRLAGASLRPMRDVTSTSVRAGPPVMLADVYRQVAPHDEQGAGGRTRRTGTQRRRTGRKTGRGRAKNRRAEQEYRRVYGNSDRAAENFRRAVQKT